MPHMVILQKTPFSGTLPFLEASESQCFTEQILSGPKILNDDSR